MKLFKKILVVVTSLMLFVTLASCGEEPKPEDKTEKVTIWVSEVKGVKELTEQQIAKFKEENPDYKFNATVQGVSEADAATQMITDVETGADIFCFAQDQLARLVQANALTELATSSQNAVRQNNDASSVQAATVAGKLYAYPITSDNGYYMYYDKSVVQQSSLGSLEAIIADCEAASRYFGMELETSGWYNIAFMFALDSDGNRLCHSNWTFDADGEINGVDDDFNSDNGLIALKGMQKLLKSKAYLSTSDGAAFAGSDKNEETGERSGIATAVVVSGTWAASTVKDILKDNFAATKLPSFTVDGKTYQMGSYSGNKLLGVKPSKSVERAKLLQAIATYLSNATCQEQRFDQFGWGPSNTTVQKMPKVQDDVTLSALAAQNEFAVPQPQIHGSWWDIAKTYPKAAKDATTEQELRDALAAYDKAIKGLFQMSEDEKNAWTVIGTIGGSNWDTDFAMTKKVEGTKEIWTSVDIQVAAGNKFKVRQGKSWDVNYGITDGVVVKGGSDVEIADAGTYKIVLTIDGDTVTLEAIPAN